MVAATNFVLHKSTSLLMLHVLCPNALSCRDVNKVVEYSSSLFLVKAVKKNGKL